MNIIDSMDYRYENPNQNIDVDVKIAQALISRPREKNTLEQFELWASLSKNSEKINSIINSYKSRVINNEVAKTM